VLSQVRAGQFQPVRAFAADIPPGLEAIIQRAMDPDRTRRYSSAAEMVYELENLRKGKHESTLPLTTKRPARGKKWNWRRMGVGASAAALVALLCWLGIMFLPGAGPGMTPGVENDRRGSDTMPKEESPWYDFSWMQAYPKSLLERDWNHPAPLFYAHHEPIWKHVVYGQGRFHNWDKHMDLASGPGETFLALDYDPQRRWFEYRIEVMRPVPLQADSHELGVFFGWDFAARDKSRGQGWFFTVELKTQPTREYPHGHVRIGYRRIHLANKTMTTEGFRAIPGSKGKLAMQRTTPWHLVWVRVIDEAISIGVDEDVKSVVTISMAEMRQHDAGASRYLDPRGALGIWVAKGVGNFRNGSITALKGNTR
jgi:hypothetical protein